MAGEGLAPWLPWLTAFVSAVVMPIAVFVMQRRISSKMDEGERKRDAARAEAEEERVRDEEWRRAMTAGIRSLLRSEIIHFHRKGHAEGGTTLEEKEYVTRLYEAYHGLGGNGIGTQLYEEYMELPTNGREQ